MLGQTSLPDEKMSLHLQVETDQAAWPQDVASRKSTRVLWTGLGLATLMLIGVSACALPLLASHASADPSRHAPHVVAYGMPALRPRSMRPARISEIKAWDGRERRGPGPPRPRGMGPDRFSEMYAPNGRGPELPRPRDMRPGGFPEMYDPDGRGLERDRRDSRNRAQSRTRATGPNGYPYDYYPQRNGYPNDYYPQRQQNFRDSRPISPYLERNADGLYRPGPGLPWASRNAYPPQRSPEFAYPPRNGRPGPGLPGPNPYPPQQPPEFAYPPRKDPNRLRKLFRGKGPNRFQGSPERWAGPNAYPPQQSPYPPRNAQAQRFLATQRDASSRAQARAVERERYYPRRNGYPPNDYYPQRRGDRVDRRSAVQAGFAALIGVPTVVLLAAGADDGYSNDYYPQRQVPTTAVTSAGARPAPPPVPAPRPPARPPAPGPAKAATSYRQIAEEFARSAALEDKAAGLELPALKKRADAMKDYVEAADAKAAALDAKDAAIRAVVSGGEAAALEKKAAQLEAKRLRLDANAAAMELKAAMQDKDR
jgi:hypothetical protein